jgi:hypothetical protein
MWRAAQQGNGVAQPRDAKARLSLAMLWRHPEKQGLAMGAARRGSDRQCKGYGYAEDCIDNAEHRQSPAWQGQSTAQPSKARQRLCTALHRRQSIG